MNEQIHSPKGTPLFNPWAPEFLADPYPFPDAHIRIDDGVVIDHRSPANVNAGVDDDPVPDPRVISDHRIRMDRGVRADDDVPA